MVQMYLEGLSSYDIAKKTGITSETVRYHLKKAGIKMKKPNDYTDKLNTYEFNYNWLDVIDCQEKAYFLGLFAADGCNYSRGNSFAISLAEEDSYILEQLQKAMNLNRPLKYRPSSDATKKPQEALVGSSKHFCDRLNHFGFHPQKTYDMEFCSEKYPKNMFPHFFRGLLDGDGCIHIIKNKNADCYTGTAQIATSTICAQQISAFLFEELKIETRIYDYKTYAVLAVRNLHDTLIFLNWIYKDASIYLIRKYNKFLTLVESRENAKVDMSENRRNINLNRENILKDYKNGLTNKELREKYNCSESTVYRITRGTCFGKNRINKFKEDI